MDKRLIIIFSSIFLLINLPVFSETIVFKSGKTVEGKILEKTDKYIKVSIGSMSTTYSLESIEGIYEKPVNIKKQSSYEQITIATYYPAPYGVYTELKTETLTTEKLTIGENTFITIQGSNVCPEGYEIFAVRWVPVRCSSAASAEHNMCETNRFTWATDLDYKDRVASTCRYCIESQELSDSHYKFCIKNGGNEIACRYTCTKWDDCMATEKEYTVCVKLPKEEPKKK